MDFDFLAPALMGLHLLTHICARLVPMPALELMAQALFAASVILYVIALLRKVFPDPEIADKSLISTFTGLGWAASIGDADLCGSRIAAGDDVDAVDSFGRTALHITAGSPDPSAFKIIKLLLDAGAHVNAQSQSGDTPLHVAASSDVCDNHPKHDVLVELLRYGASLTIVNDKGQTPQQCTSRVKFDAAVSAFQAWQAREAAERHAATLAFFQLHRAKRSPDTPPMPNVVAGALAR